MHLQLLRCSTLVCLFQVFKHERRRISPLGLGEARRFTGKEGVSYFSYAARPTGAVGDFWVKARLGRAGKTLP